MGPVKAKSYTIYMVYDLYGMGSVEAYTYITYMVWAL